MNNMEIKYNKNINMEDVRIQKKYWLDKICKSIDKRQNKNIRDVIVFKIMELDKCLQIDDYYVNTHYKKSYDHNDYFLKSFEIDRKDFEENGLSLYSVNDGGFINPFMINQWYKECKSELLKRL